MRRLVVKSSPPSTAPARGTRRCSPRTPEPRSLPRSGCGKDSVEVEGYVRGFARRRPDVDVTMLRFANFIGPSIRTAAHRLLRLPVVPTVLGLRPPAAVRARGRRPRGAPAGHDGSDHGGIVNVAGDGVLTAVAGGPPGRPAGAAGAAGALRRRRHAVPPHRPRRLLPRADPVPLLRPRRSTPPGCARRSASSRGTRPGRPSPTSSADAGCTDPLVAGRRASPRRSGSSLGRAVSCRQREAVVSERAAERLLAVAHAAQERRRGPGRRAGRRRSRERAPPRTPDPAPSRTPRSRRRATLEDRSWPTSWRSCAGASPATTRSTSSASTPSSPTPCCWRSLRPLYQRWFRVEVRGIENIPDEGGALVVANHSGAIAIDSLMTPLAVHDEHPHAPVPADARRRPRVRDARSSASWPARAARRWRATPTPSGCSRRGELVGVWPEGFKGIGKPFTERYKLQRFGRGGFVSAALRTRAPIVPCSIVGAEEIYPILGNMPTAGPAARPAVRPDHADLPVARPARRDPAAEQVDHRVRRAGAHRRVRRPARPTTRCSCSTSPTRCARRSSTRSTPCSCSAAPSSSDAQPLAAAEPAVAPAAAAITAPAARRPPAATGIPDLAPPCGRCGSRGPASRAPRAWPRSVGVRVDRARVPDQREHRDVVRRVAVRRAARQVQALALGQRPHRLRLGRAVQQRPDQAAGVDAVDVLRDGAERAGQAEPVGDDLARPRPASPSPATPAARRPGASGPAPACPARSSSAMISSKTSSPTARSSATECPAMKPRRLGLDLVDVLEVLAAGEEGQLLPGEAGDVARR